MKLSMSAIRSVGTELANRIFAPVAVAAAIISGLARPIGSISNNTVSLKHDFPALADSKNHEGHKHLEEVS